MFLLGYLIIKGKGIENDDNKAFNLLKKASELGNKRANTLLRICYKQAMFRKF